jgi:hypothetical protein
MIDISSDQTACNALTNYDTVTRQATARAIQLPRKSDLDCSFSSKRSTI